MENAHTLQNSSFDGDNLCSTSCIPDVFVTIVENERGAKNANTLQNNSFEGDNFEHNSHRMTSNMALESWGRDRYADVSTLETLKDD